MEPEINKAIMEWLFESNEHTKAELAKSLGITHRTLNSRIRGEAGWRWSEIVALAEFTGCNVSDFVRKE